LAGFWPRLVAAFLDWILIGIVAAAIGELFGVEAPSPPSADGGVNVQFESLLGLHIFPAQRPYSSLARSMARMGSRSAGMLRVLPIPG
jgi:hypothetical protein